MVRQSGRGAVVPLQARQAATEPAERSLGTGTGATHGDVAYVSPGFRTPLTQPCFLVPAGVVKPVGVG